MDRQARVLREAGRSWRRLGELAFGPVSWEAVAMLLESAPTPPPRNSPLSPLSPPSPQSSKYFEQSLPHPPPPLPSVPRKGHSIDAVGMNVATRAAHALGLREGGAYGPAVWSKICSPGKQAMEVGIRVRMAASNEMTCMRRESGATKETNQFSSHPKDRDAIRRRQAAHSASNIDSNKARHGGGGEGGR